MRFTLSKLQHYFEKPLPPVEKVVEAVTMYAFEVEGAEKVGDDWVLEIKVLPDRAHDAKTELGMARELSAVLNQPLKDEFIGLPDVRTARAKIEFTAPQLNAILGLGLSEAEIVKFLRRVHVVTEKKKSGKLVALIPPERQDLNIREDLADEVGRLYGLDQIPVALLPSVIRKLEPEQNFLLANKLREILVRAGFTEVYGYTFREKGELAVEKPLASDKAYLRTNLTDGLREKTAFNLQHTLFDDEPVKIFEIGTVFSGGWEIWRLGTAVGYKNKKAEITETDFAELAAKIDLTEMADLKPFIHLERVYRPISLYPRVIRDIAIFVPGATRPDEVAQIMKDNAGKLLVEGPILFDEFKKGEKKSLAFRLVFQSAEKTLSDPEVNQAVSRLVSALEKHSDWEVRK